MRSTEYTQIIGGNAPWEGESEGKGDIFAQPLQGNLSGYKKI